MSKGKMNSPYKLDNLDLKKNKKIKINAATAKPTKTKFQTDKKF